MSPLAIRFNSQMARSQRGAALVIGMILLLVLTVLGISGLVTATLELQMAGNAQKRMMER